MLPFREYSLSPSIWNHLLKTANEPFSLQGRYFSCRYDAHEYPVSFLLSLGWNVPCCIYVCSSLFVLLGSTAPSIIRSLCPSCTFSMCCLSRYSTPAAPSFRPLSQYTSSSSLHTIHQSSAPYSTPLPPDRSSSIASTQSLSRAATSTVPLNRSSGAIHDGYSTLPKSLNASTLPWKNMLESKGEGESNRGSIGRVSAFKPLHPSSDVHRSTVLPQPGPLPAHIMRYSVSCSFAPVNLSMSLFGSRVQS